MGGLLQLIPSTRADALWLASVVFVVALFVSLTTHHPALVGFAALIYCVFVGVGLALLIRSRLTGSSDQPAASR